MLLLKLQLVDLGVGLFKKFLGSDLRADQKLLQLALSRLFVIFQPTEPNDFSTLPLFKFGQKLVLDYFVVVDLLKDDFKDLPEITSNLMARLN